jgi:hypothetical protein
MPAGSSRAAHGVDGFVHAHGIHPGFAGIGGQLFARALGEADHRHMGIARLHRRGDAGIGRDHPAFEFARGQAAGPAVEQLQASAPASTWPDR